MYTYIYIPGIKEKEATNFKESKVGGTCKGWRKEREGETYVIIISKNLKIL